MIAVLGANGQLGSAFVRALGSECIPVTRDDLDLGDTDAIPYWVNSVKADLVINCAAYNAVDAAETDVETARAMNALAVGTLAKATLEHGVGLVTFSSDYVFDGEKKTPYVESDEPNPLNVYGRTKLEGEQLALDSHPAALVIRTSWLLSAHHRNFLTTMLAQLDQGGASVVNDQTGRPTFVHDLALGTLEAIDAGARGILHLTNQGETTWYGLACEIAANAGLDPTLVKPTTSGEINRPAARPENSRLDSERLERLGIGALPNYEDAISQLVYESRTGTEHL